MTDQFYRQKTYRFQQVSRQYRRIISILLIIIVILFVLLLTSQKTIAHADQRTVKTYDSVCIYSGDTLWSIAEAHHPTDLSVKEYMNQIIAINHLSDSSLVSGEYLIIPVYTTLD